MVDDTLSVVVIDGSVVVSGSSVVNSSVVVTRSVVVSGSIEELSSMTMIPLAISCFEYCSSTSTSSVIDEKA